MTVDKESFAPIIAAVPGFSDRWSEFVRESEEEESIPWYTGMAALARYIVDSHASNSTSEFPEFFRSVEAALQIGDEELSGLLAIGLFEDIQTIASHRPFGYSAFERWLGPTSLATWREVEAGMRRVAQWAVKHYRQHWWQLWRPKPFDAGKALSQVENPALREIIETMYAKKR